MPLDSRSANPGGIKTVEEDEERASKTERARRNSRGRHGCWPNHWRERDPEFAEQLRMKACQLREAEDSAVGYAKRDAL